MQKLKYILLFLAILLVGIALILAVDHIYLNGMVTRDFTKLFVCEGMGSKTALVLLGYPDADVGSGLPIMQYTLPFGHYLYVTYSGDGIVIRSEVNERAYPLSGILLPLIVTIVAVIDAAVLILIRKSRSQ